MEHDELLVWAVRGLVVKCIDLSVKSPDEVNAAKVRLRAQRLQEHLTKLDDLVEEAKAHGVSGQLPIALKMLAQFPR